MKLLTRRTSKQPAKRSTRSSRQPACIGCGCTELNACDGSCSWASVDPPVCSRCTNPRGPFEAEMFGTAVHGPGPELQIGGRVLEFDCAGPAEARDLARALNRAWLAGRKVGQALLLRTSNRRSKRQKA